MDKLCYSMPETARLLSVGVRTVYRAIADGNLRAIKIGRRTIVSEAAIQAFIKNATNPDIKKEDV